MGLFGDIALPAGLGLVIIAVLFLLKGFLSFAIGVPLWIILSFVVAAGVVAFIPTNIIFSFYRYGKEGFTFMQCRKEGIPCIMDVEIGTSNVEFIPGKKNNPKDPVFIDEQSGIKVDPTLISAYAEPLRAPNGLMIIGFGHHNWLPQTARNHLAFKAIADYFNPDNANEPWMVLTKQQKLELSAFTTNELIELISKPEHFLEADVKTKLGKYFKLAKEDSGKLMLDKNGNQLYVRQFQTKDGKWIEQTTVPDMLMLVRKAKADITKLPIATGYFSMNEAFKYNNTPYSAQHLSQLKNLITALVREDLLKGFNAWTYGTIMVACIGMVGLVVFVLMSTVLK